MNSYSDSSTENIPLQLKNGTQVMIEGTVLGGEENISFDFLPFDQVTQAIEAIAPFNKKGLDAVTPKSHSYFL